MHGAPWGTMDSWLRFEVEERAKNYGRLQRAHHDGRPIPEQPITHAADPHAVAALSRDEVTACA